MLGLGLLARLFRKLVKYTLVLVAFGAVFSIVLVFAYDWSSFVREQIEGFANRTGLKVSINGAPYMQASMPPTLVLDDVTVQQPVRDRAGLLREVIKARRVEVFLDIAQSLSTGTAQFGLRLIEPQIQMSSNLSLQTAGQTLGVSSVSVTGGTGGTGAGGPGVVPGTPGVGPGVTPGVVPGVTPGVPPIVTPGVPPGTPGTPGTPTTSTGC